MIGRGRGRSRGSGRSQWRVHHACLPRELGLSEALLKPRALIGRGSGRSLGKWAELDDVMGFL